MLTVNNHRPDLESHFKARPVVSEGAQPIGLLSLPNELLLKIIGDEGFTSLEALVALGITCRRLYELTHELIGRCRDRSAAPWAFGRVVCLGDYADYEDVPKTLYTASERAMIEENRRNAGEDEVDMSYGGIYQLKIKRGSIWLGVHTYDDPEAWPEETYEWLARFTKADRKRYDAILGVTYPDRKDWVLANFSKKEYVRASEIAKLAKRPNDPQPFLPNCVPDLGQALLTRIAWSSDDSLSMATDEVTENIHRGKWVGDEICITPLEWLDQSTEQWMDISPSVVRDLIHCFRANFGARWLEVIKKGFDKSEQYEWRWMASDGDDEAAKLGRRTGSPPPRRWFW